MISTDSLPGPLKHFVKERMEVSGQSEQQVIEEALAQHLAWHQYVQQKLAQGLASGQPTPMTESELDKIVEGSIKRAAANKRQAHER